MRTILLLLVACVFIPLAQASAAGDAIFRINSIETDDTCPSYLMITPTSATTFNTGCTDPDALTLTNPTDNCTEGDENSQVQFETTKKLLLAAFLGNKRIKAYWGSCLTGGRAGIKQLRIIVD